MHCDNAAEFLSHDFKELLASEGISQTICPPHVHQLNGVAERAIQSIIELVSVNLVASNLPIQGITFWAYVAQHAVDIINRTTGPPGSNLSSYEMFTGKVPKIMASSLLAAARTSCAPKSTSAKAPWTRTRG